MLKNITCVGVAGWGILLSVGVSYPALTQISLRHLMRVGFILETASVIFFVNFKQILSGTFGPHTSTS